MSRNYNQDYKGNIVMLTQPPLFNLPSLHGGYDPQLELSSMAISSAGSGAAAAAATYLGASFMVFLGLLPRSSVSYIASLQSRNRILALKLFEAEDQIKQIKSRRREDSKANARVAEILAGQRNAWQQEERRLLARLDAAEAETAGLRARVAEMEDEVERLRREIGDREEMLDFMSRGAAVEEEEEEGDFGRDLEENGEYSGRVRTPKGLDRGTEACLFDRNVDLDEMGSLYGQHNSYAGRVYSPPPLPPACHAWTDKSSGWKDTQYDSLESTYHMKHLVARRESPWKVDGDSTGVSSKLKLLEHELVNLEKVVRGDLSKVPSLMKKQAKRYQSLAEKIDDLCRRMQASEPSEPSLNPEFRTQRQTEFLLEAFRLQSRATETRQKLTALQAETTRSFAGDDNHLLSQAVVSTRISLGSIRNNLQEIQRNMEIWLARILGDLEGILARDGASRVRDYYMSRYPFVG